jgi:hypothetical protein
MRITGGRRLPEVLLDEIAPRTDAVPSFIEVMTKTVIESRVLREGPDAYYLESTLRLHDSLITRLDRLQTVKETCTIVAFVTLQENVFADAMHRIG